MAADQRNKKSAVSNPATTDSESAIDSRHCLGTTQPKIIPRNHKMIKCFPQFLLLSSRITKD